MSAALVAVLLADPARAMKVDATDWNGILCAARAERLLASLAYRLNGLSLPDDVAAVLDGARADAETGRTAALWEAEMARRALGRLNVPVVLLKGTAFAAAGLEAGRGRVIGDLDILVPRDRLDVVEAALLAAGWEWVKPDPYDDQYYRRWMHELPPLIHRDRDRMIDVHHTILPLTARPTPDADALLADRVPLENGLGVLSPEDMIIHAAAHLLADGDLAGGLRNLWDIDCLIREFDGSEFIDRLRTRAALHQLLSAVDRAFRLRHAIFVAPMETGNTMGRRAQTIGGPGLRPGDRLFVACFLARDGWGRPTQPLLRFAFYIRSHWLRMPPFMLAKHLWTKWRKG